MIVHKPIPSEFTISGWNVLYTELNEPTNQNSIKVLKVIDPTNKTYKLWGLV